MAEERAVEDQHVLTIDGVTACIKTLLQRRLHRFFPAYLHLRQQATLQNTTTAITPNWNALGELLDVPEGPYGRPYYVPFWDQRRDAAQEWRAENLAGSYSPSSLRGVPRKVIDTDPDGRYELRERHWELAREHLAYGKPVPVLALAGFLLRNFALIGERSPTRRDLVMAFYDHFGYGDGESEEVAHLFDLEGVTDDADWFEPFPPPESE